MGRMGRWLTEAIAKRTLHQHVQPVPENDLAGLTNGRSAPPIDFSYDAPERELPPESGVNTRHNRTHDLLNKHWGITSFDEIPYIVPDKTEENGWGDLIFKLQAGGQISWCKLPRGDGSSFEFIGKRKNAFGKDPPFGQDEANATVALAAERGWDTLQLHGDAHARGCLWLAAMRHNLEELRRDPNAVVLLISSGAPLLDAPARAAFAEELAMESLELRELLVKAMTGKRASPAENPVKEPEAAAPVADPPAPPPPSTASTPAPPVPPGTETGTVDMPAIPAGTETGTVDMPAVNSKATTSMPVMPEDLRREVEKAQKAAEGFIPPQADTLRGDFTAARQPPASAKDGPMTPVKSTFAGMPAPPTAPVGSQFVSSGAVPTQKNSVPPTTQGGPFTREMPTQKGLAGIKDSAPDTEADPPSTQRSAGVAARPPRP